jgi:hypothetical protein
MVLDRLLGHNRAARPVPDDFGVLLTPDTIEPALGNARAAQSVYRRSHPEDIALIRSLVEERIGCSHNSSSVAMLK